MILLRVISIARLVYSGCKDYVMQDGDVVEFRVNV